MRMLSTGLRFLAMLGLTVAVANGADYTIKGTIKTVAGTCKGENQPVKRVTVTVHSKVGADDQSHGPTFTGTDGAFEVTFSRDASAVDVYVYVDYLFQAPDNKLIHVREDGSSADLCYTSPVTSGVTPGTRDLNVINLPAARANIGSHAGDCLWWIKGHASWWSMPDDLIGYAMPTSYAGLSNESAGKIFITATAYDPPSGTASRFSSIHHETGHAVHHRAHGGNPPGPAVALHDWDYQTNEGHALTEAFAEYVACCSGPTDSGTTLPADTRDWWRGLHGTGILGSGTDNSGDIVEGAILKVWIAVGNFSDSFHAISDVKPSHFKAWVDRYLSTYATTSARKTTLFEACQANGIVYTRGKITAFAETAPPNSAPPSTGNMKTIGGVTFLRGTVKPTIGQNTKDELHLSSNSSVITATKKKLGHKTTANGLDENIPFSGWAFGTDVAWGTELSLDTVSLGNGDHDLIVQTENGYGWWDNFTPTFEGDSDATRNKDEKWLKHLQTWYNQDTNPTTDDEGKVSVDNNAPEIVPSSTFPPAN